MHKAFLTDYPAQRLPGLRNEHLEVGLNRIGHMSFLTGQDRTPKFAGQVLPDRTESGLIFKHFNYHVWAINSHMIRSLDTLVSKVNKEKKH